MQVSLTAQVPLVITVTIRLDSIKYPKEGRHGCISPESDLLFTKFLVMPNNQLVIKVTQYIGNATANSTICYYKIINKCIISDQSDIYKKDIDREAANES